MLIMGATYPTAQAVGALPSGPPFDCVGRRATVRAIPLRSGRTVQVSALLLSATAIFISMDG